MLERIVEWQPVAFSGAAVRIVPPENLHVTLAFLGGRPADEVPAIVGALREAAAGSGPIELALGARPYRETRSVGMLVLRDLHGSASALADDLHGRLEALGVYTRERRAWLPHVTVVRFTRPPRHEFGSGADLQLGRFSPSDAALYTSVLRPGGAQYQLMEPVALGG